MRTTLFLIFLLLLSACDKDNSLISGLNLDANSIKRAEEQYDKKELLSSLKDIELFHKLNRTGLKLNVPAKIQEIKEVESVFGCDLPEELQELWRWHNGESTDKFIWYHKFLSTSESISQYRLLVLTSSINWNKNWIPVFEYQGEWYGVQCGNSTPKASPVILYFTESGTSVAYTNLTTYMQVIAKAVNNGGLKWKENWWDDDMQTVSNIHAELNLGVKFPYYVKK
jgi:cell wall assembly regulator SMI1